MKNIFANKKLLLVLIVVLVGAGIGGVVLYKYKIQKPPTPFIASTPPETPSDISPEAVKAKCLADVSEMDEEQIIEEINAITLTTTSLAEASEESRNINKKAVEYFFCNFDNSDKSEEIYQKTKALINKLRLPEERMEKVLKDLENGYSLAKKNYAVIFENSLAYPLALGDLIEVCPYKLPDLCLKVNTDFLKSHNVQFLDEKTIDWCKNICDLIKKYSENNDKIEKEIINFKDWDSDPTVFKTQYLWRIAMAYRFGGKDSSLKVCNNIKNTNDKNDCISQTDKLMSAVEKNKVREEEKKKCIKLHEELEGLICETR